jgi:hypothetical protein
MALTPGLSDFDLVNFVLVVNVVVVVVDFVDAFDDDLAAEIAAEMVVVVDRTTLLAVEGLETVLPATDFSFSSDSDVCVLKGGAAEVIKCQKGKKRKRNMKNKK